MPDLEDGETVEMKGSGARPYVLKNTGGVYSCSCPAWRNQSIAIEKRTCKHLRKLRGDAAEEARTGDAVAPARAPKDGEAAAGPPLLLAESWDNAADLSGWWMSEKLDGVRAYWDGKQFLSRQGNLFLAPDWFVQDLPPVPLDGELWIDRKRFQRTVSIVRRQDRNELWQEVRFLIFDAPACPEPFEARLAFLANTFNGQGAGYARPHEHSRCESLNHLREELARIEALGGEGLMLREPASRYEVGRSYTLLKVKSFRDAEAVVVAHQPGAGRHKGRLGALLVQMENGTRFAVGTGFSDAERAAPPPVGSIITYRYQELSDGGVPRFPSYVRVRTDLDAGGTSDTDHLSAQSVALAEHSPVSRRFEFTGGASRKFWEIAVADAEVTVRYGRIGSAGQSRTKVHTDAAAAVRQAEKLIAEKRSEGYLELE